MITRIDKDTIGGRIQWLRRRKGLTQKEFAGMVFATTSAVSHWEHGKALPSGDLIISICKAFNVSADWLLGLKG